MKIFKRVLGGILGVLGVCLLLVTAAEYRPEKTENVSTGSGDAKLEAGKDVRIMTYNVGYAGLDRDADFFMDGGKDIQPESAEKVQANMEGIAGIVKDASPDIAIMQEVDVDSKRSYHKNQAKYYDRALGEKGMFAYNFKVKYVPYPMPPIGKVSSGLYTNTLFKTQSAKRISLPESFSWPMKTCNLKRCMLESRIPVAGTDKTLVVINFHLEAYDSGEGKIAQTKALRKKLAEEYEKGNYVIAGGDFNQTFEGVDKYKITNKDSWVPGVIGRKDLPEHFDFAVADNFPTCRLLSAPYTGDYETSQVYVIDGFIVSDNVEIRDLSVINTDFTYTDHQPCVMDFVLKQD